MTGRRKPRPQPAPIPKRKPAQTPSKSPRKARTQTLMKVSLGDGWRNRVTVQLPAWLLVGCALLLLMCGLALLFSPDVAARAAVAVYEFIQHFTREPE